MSQNKVLYLLRYADLHEFLLANYEARKLNAPCACEKTNVATEHANENILPISNRG